MKNNPLISVVTVSYNAVSTIEQTILSVINQTYPHIEYIIIDGGSTDGTVDIIKKYADKIAYWVSEPDKGIYDAMNKGIKVATGEWINFMNSGDCLYRNDTIEKILNKSSTTNNVSIIYGKTMKIFEKYCTIELPPMLSKIKSRLPFCHQSSFIKLELQQMHPYNTNYKLVADDEFFYSMYMNNVIFLFVDEIISKYDAYSGVSSCNIKQALWENYQIRGKSNNIYFLFIVYLPLLLRKMIKSFFISILVSSQKLAHN